MDPKAEALTLALQLGERLSALAIKGGARPERTDWEYRRLWAEADRLQRSDPAEGSICKSKLLGLAGDIDAALYWLENAKKNGAKHVQVDEFLLLLLNGKMHAASALFDEAVANRGPTPLHMFMRYACCAGWFDRVELLVAMARDQKLTFKPTVWMHLAPRAVRILEEHRFTREMMNDTIAEMQAVLDTERTHWCGEMPLIELAEEGTPQAYVRMQFAVEFDAATAADMSWRLAERLVNRDLDRPGLIVGYLGSESPVVCAAEASAA